MTTETKMTIVEYLRMRRGMSRKELSSRSGVSERTLYRLERGSKTTELNAKKIAFGLNTTFDLLVNKDNNFEEDYVVPIKVHYNKNKGNSLWGKTLRNSNVDLELSKEELEERRKRLY